jgi:hypothetical protein
MQEIRAIHVEGRLWRDKVNGNTYNSSQLFINGELVQVLSMRYGYGDMYIFNAISEAVKAGLLPKIFETHYAPSRTCRELGIAFTTSERHGLKREMFKA